MLHLCFYSLLFNTFFISSRGFFFPAAYTSPVLRLFSSKNDNQQSGFVNPVEGPFGIHDFSFQKIEGMREEKLGRVSLVGAGPGDPELLTVAAIRELQQADLVIADRLVSQEILDLITCELKVARKRPGCADQAQVEIYGWVQEAVAQGRRVVRLKIGDPLVFGRGGEEVLEFRKLGVEPLVVPGISAAMAAPLLGGVPLTHRGVANQVVLGTGMGQNGTKTGITPYDPQTTAVFLMAVGRLQELCGDLKEHGYPGTCPVAIVEQASTPRQRTIIGTIDTIHDIATELNVRPPSTIVFGDCVRVLQRTTEGLADYEMPYIPRPTAESDLFAQEMPDVRQYNMTENVF